MLANPVSMQHLKGKDQHCPEKRSGEQDFNYHRGVVKKTANAGAFAPPQGLSLPFYAPSSSSTCTGKIRLTITASGETSQATAAKFTPARKAEVIPRA